MNFLKASTLTMIKLIINIILCFLILACSPSPSIIEPNETFDITFTPTKFPPTLTSTPTLSPPDFENLQPINASNLSSLVVLSEFRLNTRINDYAVAVQWMPDSKEIYVLKNNGGMEVWNVEEGKRSKMFESADEDVRSIGWNPETHLVAYVNETTDEVSVWDLENNKFLFNLGSHTNPFVNSVSVSWSPDDAKIVSVGWDNILKIWDSSTGKEIKTIESDSFGFESVAWSPDGTQIAVGHKNGSIYIIDTESWKIVNTLLGHNSSHSGGVPVIIWSPDGSKIVSGGRDELRVIIWDSTGNMLYQLENQPLSVFGLNWSPDNNMVASGGEGWDVVITDSIKGDELFRLNEHQPYTFSVAWSPNGKLFTTIDGGGRIKIWGIHP